MANNVSAGARGAMIMASWPEDSRRSHNTSGPLPLSRRGALLGDEGERQIGIHRRLGDYASAVKSTGIPYSAWSDRRVPFDQWIVDTGAEKAARCVRHSIEVCKERAFAGRDADASSGMTFAADCHRLP
jgi:hypothetical protein